MQRGDKRERYSSVLMLAIGIAIVIGSMNYELGTLARMGPGYYPLLLGLVLSFLGVLSIVASGSAKPAEEQQEDEQEKLQGKDSQYYGWLSIIGSMLAFMTLGKYGGLIPATFVMVFVACFGNRSNSARTAFILAICVTIAAVVIFKFAMQVQFPLFRWG